MGGKRIKKQKKAQPSAQQTLSCFDTFNSLGNSYKFTNYTV